MTVHRPLSRCRLFNRRQSCRVVGSATLGVAGPVSTSLAALTLASASSAAASPALTGTPTGPASAARRLIATAGSFASAACRPLAVRAGSISTWHLFTSLNTVCGSTALTAPLPMPPSSAAHFKGAALDFKCLAGHQGFTDNAARGSENSAVGLSRNLHELRGGFLVEMFEIAQSNRFQFLHCQGKLTV